MSVLHISTVMVMAVNVGRAISGPDHVGSAWHGVRDTINDVHDIGPASDKPAGDVPASDGNTCDDE